VLAINDRTTNYKTIEMNKNMSNSNRDNRRVQLASIEKKLQRIVSNGVFLLCDVKKDENENENKNDEQLTPLQHKLHKISSSGVVHGDAKKDANENGERLTPLQRKYQNSSSSGIIYGDVKRDANANATDKKVKADGLFKFLEPLQPSSGVIMKCEVTGQGSTTREHPDQNDISHKASHRQNETSDTMSTVQRTTPQRGKIGFEELFSSSSTWERTELPLQRQPDQDNKGHKVSHEEKESNETMPIVHKTSPQREKTFEEFFSPLRWEHNSKPASTGDGDDGNQTNIRKGHHRRGSRKEREFIEDDFNFDSPTSNTRTTKERQEQAIDCENHENTFVVDAQGSLDDCRIRDPDYRQRCRSKSRDRQKETIDCENHENTFFLDAQGSLDEFHIRDRDYHRRRRSNSRDAPRKGDEQQQQRPPKLQSNELSLSDGLVLHSSSAIAASAIAASNHEEDNIVRRKQRQRCSAGGIIRNNRTREEYTGFFLTSSTKDNLKHGYGITKFRDGRVFEGVYDRGMMVDGKMTYPAAPTAAADTATKDLCQSRCSGATYVGKFNKEGLRCGKGIYITATTTFLGEFQRDDPQGSGILFYHNRTDGAEIGASCSGMAATDITSNCHRFVGHWDLGLKHGYGREISVDGTVLQEGLWKEGHFAGGFNGKSDP